jgi:hypothetical protein
MSDRASFGMAADHFLSPTPDDEELDEVWRLMAQRTLSAGEVAEMLFAPTSEADNLLDWCVDQGILVSASAVHTMYARPEFVTQQDLEHPLREGSLAGRLVRYVGLTMGLLFLVGISVLLPWIVYEHTFGIPSAEDGSPVVRVGVWVVALLVETGFFFMIWLLGRSLYSAMRAEFRTR